jgi:fibronectin type 3 domain-containing protein
MEKIYLESSVISFKASRLTKNKILDEVRKNREDLLREQKVKIYFR